VIDLAARSGPRLAGGRRRCPRLRGGAGRLWSPRARARARGAKRDGIGPPPRRTRHAPRRHAPGLALRRSKDHAVPSRLKRIARSPAQGAGRARPAPSRTACPGTPHPGRARASDLCCARARISAASAWTGLRQPRPPPRFSPGPCGPMSHVSAAVPRRTPPGAPRERDGAALEQTRNIVKGRIVRLLRVSLRGAGRAFTLPKRRLWAALARDALRWGATCLAGAARHDPSAE
jgi:hypothetical protein